MTLVALANALTGDLMVRRFHADPRVQATELLLQERVPRQRPVTEPRPQDEMGDRAARHRHSPAALPHGTDRDPHTQFLSNGKYAVAVTNRGGGASSSGGIAVTRSRRDATLDPGSQFIYLRDVRSGEVWSPTYQPTRRDADRLPGRPSAR